MQIVKLFKIDCSRLIFLKYHNLSNKFKKTYTNENYTANVHNFSNLENIFSKILCNGFLVQNCQ